MTSAIRPPKRLRLEILVGRDTLEPSPDAAQVRVLHGIASLISVLDAPFPPGELSRDDIRSRRDHYASELWKGCLLAEQDPISLKQLHRDSRWMLSTMNSPLPYDEYEMVGAGPVFLSVLDFLEAMLGIHHRLRVTWEEHYGS